MKISLKIILTIILAFIVFSCYNIHAIDLFLSNHSTSNSSVVETENISRDNNSDENIENNSSTTSTGTSSSPTITTTSNSNYDNTLSVSDIINIILIAVCIVLILLGIAILIRCR